MDYVGLLSRILSSSGTMGSKRQLIAASRFQATGAFTGKGTTGAQSAIVLANNLGVELGAAQVGNNTTQVQLRRGDAEGAADARLRGGLDHVEAGYERLPIDRRATQNQHITAGNQRIQVQCDVAAGAADRVGLDDAGIHQQDVGAYRDVASVAVGAADCGHETGVLQENQFPATDCNHAAVPGIGRGTDKGRVHS